MLSQEKNRLLTEVATICVVAGASEFDTRSVKAIRILGEDLVLYKDLSGRYGLVDRQCPHRNADMS